MQELVVPEYEMVIRLGVAALLGGVIGWERETHEKSAGLRTHMLITLGSCLFTLVMLQMKQEYPGGDAGRVIQGLLLSIGFIAGGVIFRGGRAGVTGLTTAAGLWVMTGVGLAIGMGFYLLGALGAVLTFIIVFFLKRVDQRLHQLGRKEDSEKPSA